MRGRVGSHRRAGAAGAEGAAAGDAALGTCAIPWLASARLLVFSSPVWLSTEKIEKVNDNLLLGRRRTG